MTEQDPTLSSAKAAIITVGEGRGFLVGSARGSKVITAAHCLPHLPPAHPASHTSERTYKGLLGPLGGQPTVVAECIFVDPIADVAVLCWPDDQMLFAEFKAYERLVAERPTLKISSLMRDGPGWLLALDGHWESCTLDISSWFGSSLSIRDAKPEATADGTSGSPIITGDGCAVGLVSCGEDMNPVLAGDLPGRLLTDLHHDRQEDFS